MVFKKSALRCFAVAVLALSALPATAQRSGDVSTRIVGGSFVPSGWYTHTAALLNSNLQQGCGGSLVAPRWVVTAAHCTQGWSAYVRVGSIDRSSGGQLVRVIRRINHPSYAGFTSDIALLELETAVTSIAPVPMASADPSAGTGVRLLGWGSTQPQGNSGSQFLKQLDTSILQRSNCLSAGTGDLCIRGSSTATACYGDSGGPALVNGVLVGATSRGGGSNPNCGPEHVVYTSIAYYRSWINQYIGGTTPITYSNNNVYQIPDNWVVDSPIAVSGRTGNGSATTLVSVSIQHADTRDLKVDLIAPDGSVYTLHNRSSTPIGSYSVNLSSEALNGSWRLRVSDNRTGITGQITRWSIRF
jgi:secreted trypsin-like serine protease